MEKFENIGKQIKNHAKVESVNLIHPFIEVQQGKKLSIVGIYENHETSIVNGKGDRIPFKENDYYYGLTPAFGGNQICVALKNGVFNDSNSFEKFIDENANLFTIPYEMKKYARALFAKVLVKMSTMFGYCFKYKNKKIFDSFHLVTLNKWIKNIDYDINEQEQVIRLLGQPNEEFLQSLDNLFSLDSDGILISKSNPSDHSFLNAISLKQVSLVRGRSYYSGVLPRVKKFEWSNTEYSNSDVSSITVVFGRSTFATMDAFDGSYIKHHRLLKDYYSLLEEIDEHEDKLIHEYFNDLSEDNDKVMEKVNLFLEKSYSAHNLAVSGNIVSNDGYLLLAKRGKKTIDMNSYYCSINGQSEICDNRVEFYKQSVFEDMPTINIEDDNRIDFMGEMERETEAELNIYCPKSQWNLKGISFLSITNDNSEKASYRRFHFNILGECKANYSLSEIIELQKSATERFESSKLIGIKINKYSNHFMRIFHSIITIFLWILKSKDLISSILALAIFALGITELKNSEFTLASLSSIMNVIFTTLSFVVFIKNVVTAISIYIKHKPTHLKLNIIGDCDDFYKKIHCHFSKENINFHPITDVMVYEYLKSHLK